MVFTKLGKFSYDPITAKKSSKMFPTLEELQHRVLFQNVLSREQKNKQGNNVGGVQELSVHSQKKAKSKVMYYKAP